MDAVFKKLETSLRTTQAFPPSSTAESPKPEPPSTLLWLLYLLAQHYDRRREYDLAFSMINEAITHTPTVIDLYLVKGRIMKHAGDPVAAAALADEARSMDLADRYLNGEAVKRMVKANQMDLAEQTAALFTKDGDQHNTLFDMQGMWYELVSGDGYLRHGKLGKALKMYLWIHKHYNDILEDQFDFHTYCLRKMTLRAYVKMLAMEDRLHSHRFFCRGAQGAIRCYLRLFDNPPKAAAEEEEAAMAALSSAERKKFRAKQRKAEAKAKKEKEDKAKEEEAAAAAAAAAKDKSGKKRAHETIRPVDPDPDGEKLILVEDPLAEAVKYLRLLQEHNTSSLETQLLAFDVQFRRKKLLLALQALKKVMRIDPEHPDVHRCFVRFFHLIESLPEAEGSAEALVRQVIAAEQGELRGDKTLVDCNDEFLARHSSSLPHRAAAAEMTMRLQNGDKARAVEILESSVPAKATSGVMIAEGALLWDLSECVAVHQLLERTFEDSAAASRWKERCQQLFPRSVYFEGQQSSVHVGVPKSMGSMSEVTEEVLEITAANGISKKLSGLSIKN
eukprot:TRINITY_DN7656_c0_g1_i1.p1 TRINITY_DN7656_c0_g1~~TRINITY_DN7656_c0_g1_i1.p1  ORF type:complete len:640 (-),score=182.18 TRINITY_DN7656_c0_g1_i1:425-2110(-)